MKQNVAALQSFSVNRLHPAMPESTLLTRDKRAVTVALTAEGLTPKRISRRIKRTSTVVKRYLSNPSGYNRKPFSEENKKLTDRDCRTLILEASKEGSSAAQTLHFSQNM